MLWVFWRRMQLCEQRRRREHLVNSRQSPSISTIGLIFGKNRMIPHSLGVSQLAAWSIPILNAFHNVRSQVSYLNDVLPIRIAHQHCARADQDLDMVISMPRLSIFPPPPNFKTAMPHTPCIRRHHLSASDLQDIPILVGVYYISSIPTIPRGCYPMMYYQRNSRYCLIGHIRICSAWNPHDGMRQCPPRPSPRLSWCGVSLIVPLLFL